MVGQAEQLLDDPWKKHDKAKFFHFSESSRIMNMLNSRKTLLKRTHCCCCCSSALRLCIVGSSGTEPEHVQVQFERFIISRFSFGKEIFPKFGKIFGSIISLKTICMYILITRYLTRKVRIFSSDASLQLGNSKQGSGMLKFRQS